MDLTDISTFLMSPEGVDDLLWGQIIQLVINPALNSHSSDPDNLVHSRRDDNPCNNEVTEQWGMSNHNPQSDNPQSDNPVSQRTQRRRNLKRPPLREDIPLIDLTLEGDDGYSDSSESEDAYEYFRRKHSEAGLTYDDLTTDYFLDEEDNVAYDNFSQLTPGMKITLVLKLIRRRSN